MNMMMMILTKVYFVDLYYTITLQCMWAGIATCYGLDGPGIESWWGQCFPHPSRPGLGPTQPPIQWQLGLSQG